MGNDSQLAKFENKKIVEIISDIPNLNDKDRHELTKRILSDDIEIRKNALEKLSQSQIAHNDLMTILGELNALSKQGMYIKSKQVVKTGSGSFEIEMKGGDTKLIVPVLSIAAIIIIVLLIIFFL